MAPKAWSSRIQTSSMVERLILSLLLVIALVALCLQLRTGPMWDWIVTVAAMFFVALFSNPLRGTRLDYVRPAESGNESLFWELIDILADHRWARFLASNFALRTISALLFAIAVASLEQWLWAILFGSSDINPTLSGLISLFIVLAPVYILVAYLRRNQEPSEWNARLLAWFEKVTKTEEHAATLLKGWFGSGLSKALLAVGVRAIALMIFPWLLSSWYGVVFLSALGLALLLGGETIRDGLQVLDRFTSGERANDDNSDKSNPSERNAT